MIARSASAVSRVRRIPFNPAPARAPRVGPQHLRFTRDGDPALERELARICARVREGITALLPRRKLVAILLGGGYGRGEGGVLRTDAGDRPYNDMEFYVFLRGSTQWNEARHGPALGGLAHELSEEVGIEVEFKILSPGQLLSGPVSMFSYDLVVGHRRVYGDVRFLDRCMRHRRPEAIPRSEATRLLLNRCTGLLLALERLKRTEFTREDADFTGRNLAKARLALADAVLAATGRYHWSCNGRAQRLAELRPPACWTWFEEVREQHRRGVVFKLRPERTNASRDILWGEFVTLSRLAEQVWLWAEGHRLHFDFRSPEEYAISDGKMCLETPWWRNLLVNIRQFGPAALSAPAAACRYPRERLMRALPLLLWVPAAPADRLLRRRLQSELRTRATDFPGLVRAYRLLWERFR